MKNSQENTSGLGRAATVPPEIKGWNWGAFLFNWIWGIGNNTYIALLMFVPIVNVIMWFMLGLKGNEWAWKNRTWRNVDHFKSVQRKWAISSLFVIIIGIPLLFFISSSYLLKGDAYTLSLAAINQNEQVTELIGVPIKPGFFVFGHIKINNSNNIASLRYSISGEKASAKVYVLANKNLNEWHLNNVVVDVNETSRKIIVVKK